jgi:hypothetical protein
MRSWESKSNSSGSQEFLAYGRVTEWDSCFPNRDHTIKTRLDGRFRRSQIQARGFCLYELLQFLIRGRQ